MSEPQEIRKPNRFRITSIIIACLMFSGTSTVLLDPFADNFPAIGQPAHIATIGSPVVIVDKAGVYEATFGGNNIVVMPNANWLVVYYAGLTHVSLDGKINGTISTDLGATWGAPFTIIDTANVDDRNCLATVIGSRIIVYYVEYDKLDGISGDGYAVHSDDNGATWSAKSPLWLMFEQKSPFDEPVLYDGKYYLSYYGGHTATNWCTASLTSSTDGLTFADRTQIISADILTNWNVVAGNTTTLSLSSVHQEGTKSVELYGQHANHSPLDAWRYLSMNYTPVSPFDLSSYDGISFWAWQNVTPHATPTRISLIAQVTDSDGNYSRDPFYRYTRSDNWTQYSMNFSLAIDRYGVVDLSDIVSIKFEISSNDWSNWSGSLRIDDVCATNWDTIIVSQDNLPNGYPTEMSIVKAQDHFIAVWRNETLTEIGSISYSTNLHDWSAPVAFKINGTDSAGKFQSPSMTTINNITILSYRRGDVATQFMYSYGGYVWEGLTSTSYQFVNYSMDDGYPTTLETPTGAYYIYYTYNPGTTYVGVYSRELSWADIGGSNLYWIYSMSDGTLSRNPSTHDATINNFTSTTLHCGIGANGTMPWANFSISVPATTVSVTPNFVLGTTITLTFSGLDSGRMYRVYIDGDSANLLTASGSGVISFTYSGPWTEHQFEIVATSISGSISPLINLIFIMFAIGVVVGVIAEGTYSIRKNKMLSTPEMMRSLFNMVIYIVIGIAGLGVLYSVVA